MSVNINNKEKRMRKILFAILSVFMLGSLQADVIDMSGKVDGYDVRLFTKKSLIVGDNDFFVTIKKDGKVVKDAKVKAKFFMPEMPGMPYMEYKAKAKLQDDGSYKMLINFSMGGTWQYHLKFKTSDDEVHKLKASVNL
jgi:hypothetical protein